MQRCIEFHRGGSSSYILCLETGETPEGQAVNFTKTSGLVDYILYI